jgi:site-specific recombinase XerD
MRASTVTIPVASTEVSELHALEVRPDSDPDVPVLLFLHGMGEAGSSINELPKKSTQVSLERFARWMKETRPKQSICGIHTAELSAYLASEKKRGLAPASLKLITVAIKILFRRLKNRRAIKHDPSEVLRAPRVKSRLPEVLNKEEVTPAPGSRSDGAALPIARSRDTRAFLFLRATLE